MSAKSRGYIELGRATRLTLAAILCGAGSMPAALAQAAPSLASPRWSAPHWEVYGGYSALNTGATVYGLLPGAVAPASGCLCWNPQGAGAGIAYKLSPWLAIAGDLSGNWGGGRSTLADRLTHADFYNLSAGPKFNYSAHRLAPFAEVLAGGHRLAPDLFPHSDAFGFMAGGGVDLTLSRHFALRMVRADYVYSNHHFGPHATVPATEVRGIRLQSGLVYRFGGRTPAPPAPAAPPALPPPPPAPVEVIAPPTVTCSADPASVGPAETSTITAHGVSLQNRPLLYGYRSTAGSISGAAATTTLDTAGAPAGPITVTCTAIDDKNQSASATTSVTVFLPTVPVRPRTIPLCSIHFERDIRRPARVDNEAKACLDDITLNLLRSPDATLAIVGNAAGSEAGGKALAAERGLKTRTYLVTEKGVDASRISIYAGSGDSKQVDSVLIPAGAILDQAGMTAVDPASVKPYAGARGRRRRRR